VNRESTTHSIRIVISRELPVIRDTNVRIVVQHQKRHDHPDPCKYISVKQDLLSLVISI